MRDVGKSKEVIKIELNENNFKFDKRRKCWYVNNHNGIQLPLRMSNFYCLCRGLTWDLIERNLKLISVD